jgi:heparosan-N-sulfate-glucuronate 5-epimerase
MKKARQCIFMLNKFRRDIRSPRPRYAIPGDLHSQQLKDYYFIFDEARVAGGPDQPLISKFDENGIPVNKTYVDVQEQEYVYFPISIGQLALAVFQTYLKSGDEKDRQRFLAFAEWFADPRHYDKNEDCGIRWLTQVPLPQYRNPGPWQSAFAQSRGISVLLRGYQLTGNTEWAEKARLALKSFLVPVEEGGVSRMTQYGPFYEEYTAKVPTLVLNGMIFALCGVYDFLRVFPGDAEAGGIFDEGIRTLENILPEYDLDYWSRYNICKADWYPEVDPATIGYQRLHVTQLFMLYTLTGKEIFGEYAKIFNGQDTFRNAVRMYINKYRALKSIQRL